MKTVYKIRYKKLNKFVGPGLNYKGPEKVWDELGYARNAISQKCGGDYPGFSRKNYEIVEFELVEIGVVNEQAKSSTT